MTVLNDIVSDVRAELQGRKQRMSRPGLEEMPLFDRTPHALADALQADDLTIISEVKKASPSRGVIREDFDPVDLARQYDESGAAAISVLTEPQHFQGRLDYLADIRPVTSLPLLRKDFIIDPYQLVEARAYGADAVLLIAAILDKAQLRDLHAAADELGLSCLVEVYKIEELDKVDFDQISILGVNNRDLRTFEVDVTHALDVFEQVPEGVIRIAESGLKTSDDLAHLYANGIDAVLIGETFMRAQRPGEALKKMKKQVHELNQSAGLEQGPQ